VEWGGFLLVLAAVVLALTTSEIPTVVVVKTNEAICQVFKRGCPPAAAAAEREQAQRDEARRPAAGAVPPEPPPGTSPTGTIPPAPPPGTSTNGGNPPSQARPSPFLLNPPPNVQEQTIGVLGRTPTGREALAALEAGNIGVVWEAGRNAGAYHRDGTIHIETAGQTPEQLAATLVHEANHARSPDDPHPTDMRYEEFIEASIEEEVQSEVLAIRANQELQRLQRRSGHTVPDRPTQDVYEAAYRRAGSVFDRGEASRRQRGQPPRTAADRREFLEEAAEQALREEHVNGNLDPTGPADTYRELFGNQWDDAHSGNDTCVGVGPFNGCVSF
jgi:hypothetical protein